MTTLRKDLEAELDDKFDLRNEILEALEVLKGEENSDCHRRIRLQERASIIEEEIESLVREISTIDFALNLFHLRLSSISCNKEEILENT